MALRRLRLVSNPPKKKAAKRKKKATSKKKSSFPAYSKRKTKAAKKPRRNPVAKRTRRRRKKTVTKKRVSATRRAAAKLGWRRRRAKRNPAPKRRRRTVAKKRVRLASGRARKRFPLRFRAASRLGTGRGARVQRYKVVRKVRKSRRTGRATNGFRYVVRRNDAMANLKSTLQAALPLVGGILLSKVGSSLINKYVTPKLGTVSTSMGKYAPLLSPALLLLGSATIAPKLIKNSEHVKMLQIGAGVHLLESVLKVAVAPMFAGKTDAFSQVVHGALSEYVPMGAYISDPTNYSLPTLHSSPISDYNVSQAQAGYGDYGMGLEVSQALAEYVPEGMGLDVEAAMAGDGIFKNSIFS